MFHYFMDHAKRVGTRILDGKSVTFGEKLISKLGNFFVYGPLRDVLGLGRIRLAYTAGEAIGPEIFDFYRSLGINIKQLIRNQLKEFSLEAAFLKKVMEEQLFNCMA